MEKKKTLVLGASENPARYGNIAIHHLMRYGHPIVAVGKRAGEVEGVRIETEPPFVEDIDTITLYLNPTNQQPYYDYILSLKPKRIIFNPGTENAELASMARASGIQPVQACTLVMLGTGQY
ncbi:MAG: CoA-binding protein [Flavipsychrobacter sp.]|nr:CoA-binding protein [Flavipsychrobacter sp.]